MFRRLFPLKKSHFLSGSFTIEAAVIFSITLAVIFSLIRLVFLLHDSSSAKSISYRYLISYSMQNQEFYSYHSKTDGSLSSKVKKVLILNKMPRLTAGLKKNSLFISSSLYTVPVTFSNYHYSETMWAYLTAKELTEHNSGS